MKRRQHPWIAAIAMTALLATALPRSLAQTQLPPPSATTRPAPNVELPFEDVYRLKEGEFARFVPAPFIPSRAEHIMGVQSPTLLERGQAVFLWTKDGDLKQWSFFAGDGSVTSALQACGLADWEIGDSGRPNVRFYPLSGDWIIREDASREQKLDAVQRILRERLSDIRVEKRQVERQVTLVRGTFDPRSHPEIYVTVDGKRGQNGGGSGTLSTFLLNLGNLTHHQFVDQTDSGDQYLVWGWDISLSVDDYRLPDLLEELRKETNLTFSNERRQVSVYFISKTAAK
jgi:hypothetical protein